jgi:hypothetical protein
MRHGGNLVLDGLLGITGIPPDQGEQKNVSYNGNQSAVSAL